MTVAFGTAGIAASGSTSLAVAYPASIAAGDMLVLAICNKYPANAPALPSGWTAPANGQQSGGNGAAGIDTGTVFATVFTKIAAGTESGSLTVTVTSGNAAVGRMFRYTKTASATWSVACANGADNTGNSTAWSVTAGTDPGIAAGDMVVVASAINSDNYTYTSEALSASGVVFGAMNERQDSGTTTGQDCGLLVTDHAVTSGTSAGAPTYTATASSSATNSPAGASVFVRLREVGPMVASAAVAASASGSLTGAGAVVASAAATGAAGGTLAGAGAVVSSAAVAASASGQLDAIILGVASASASVSAAGTLAGAGALVGSSSAVASPSGTMTGAGALVGSAASTSTVTGTLTGAGAVVGSSAAAASVTGTLAGAGVFVGAAAASSTLAGTLAGSGALVGAAAVSGQVAGQLEGAGSLVGAGTASVAAGGELAGAGALVASSITTSTAAGTIEGAGALVAAAEGSVTAEGALTAILPVGEMEASASVLTVVNGALIGLAPMFAAAAGVCLVVGAIAGAGELVAAAAAHSGTTAAIHNATPVLPRTFARASVTLLARARGDTSLPMTAAASLSPEGVAMYVGDQPRLSVVFYRVDAPDTPSDPSSVVLRVRDPNDAVHVYDYALSQVTREHEGVYHVDFTIELPGLHAWRWEGGGDVVAVTEGSLVASPSAVV